MYKLVLLGYQLLNIPAWSWYWAAFRISIPAWFSWYWVCFQTLISTWSSWYWVCFQTLISTWSSWYWVCFQILISTWSSWYWVCFQTLISTWSCYWVWFNTLIPAWLLVLGSRIVFWAGMRQVCTWYSNWYKAGIICWVQHHCAQFAAHLKIWAPQISFTQLPQRHLTGHNGLLSCHVP